MLMWMVYVDVVCVDVVCVDVVCVDVVCFDVVVYVDEGAPFLFSSLLLSFAFHIASCRRISSDLDLTLLDLTLSFICLSPCTLSSLFALFVIVLIVVLLLSICLLSGLVYFGCGLPGEVSYLGVVSYLG